jgi:hypothetical protein
VGRDNELLLDLDSDKALWYCWGKLRRNLNRGFLRARSVHLFRSAAPHHYHLIVTLAGPMAALERAVWELALMSDIKRSEYNLMRILRGLPAADLLIADRAYPGMRPPDHVCSCKGKHKRRVITRHCPVLGALHGVEAGAEYFAVARDRKRRTDPLRVPVGRVPLSLILNS